MVKRIISHMFSHLFRWTHLFALLMTLSVTYSAEASGAEPTEDEALSIPIYGIAQTHPGFGIAGRIPLDFEAIDGRVGKSGLRVLGGERPEDILPRIASRVIVFDRRALQCWRIGERSLPPANLVQSSEPPFWEIYEWYIVAIIAVGVIEALLIAGLLINRARRQRAEEAGQRLAKLAEEQHRKLEETVSTMAGIVWVSRLEPGSHAMKVEFVSGCTERLGYSVEEWLSTPDFVRSIVHDEDREEFARRRDEILASGREGTLQFRWRAKDGRVLWAEEHIYPTLDEAGAVVGWRCVALDTTDRQRAEEELRRNEERYKMATSAGGVGVWDWDLKTGDIYIDPMLKSLIGYADEEIRNHIDDWGQLVHPEDAELVMACAQSHIAGETAIYEVEHRMLHKDGSVRWFLARGSVVMGDDGQPTRLVGTDTDVTERKQAQEALRQTEKLNKSIIESSNDCIKVLNMEARLLYMNPGGQKRLEICDFDEYLHAYWPNFWKGEDRHAALRAIALAKTGGTGNFQGYCPTMGGVPRWWDIAITPITDTDGNVSQLLVVSRDITERKLAEEAARQIQQRNQDILHALPDMMFVQTPDGDFIDYYADDTRKLLVPPEEFLGKNLRDLMPPELAEAFLGCFQRAKETGEVQVYEYMLAIEGEERSYEARIIHTNSDQFLSVVRDITERKRVEAQLIESEERFRNMADTAPVLIWVNGLEGCEFVNRSYLDYLGVSEEEVRKYDWVRFIHPGDRDSYLNIYYDALAARKRFETRFRFLRADGEYRWMKTIGLPRLTATGEFLGYVGSTFDITDAKQFEEAMKEALAQLGELKSQLEAEIIYLREELNLEHDFGEIVGEGEAIRNVFYKIEQVSPTNTTVLILGETGTGKELVARAIHRTSLRKNKPLIKVNCATLLTTLIESELFGHEKGAFTGATARQLGRFELANGGTIFLDEIGDLPLELQGKLLRVLQEGEFERLGSGKTIKVNVRVIAATNRNLPEEVQKGVFREDLWYRLNVFPLTVPPLRERTEDIPLLVEAFARKFSKELGKPVKAISPAVLKALQDYSWPGNIRELANVIERAMINTEGEVLRLADQLNRPRATEIPSLQQTLVELERQHILRILEETDWRIEGPKGAARILGLNPSTLRTRMAKLGIRKSKGASK